MPPGTVGADRLAERSIAVILAGQAPTGAYIASPTFPAYRYCWFRDGSFVADAMSRAGEVESAEAFFGWCADVVLARTEAIAAGADLHTRYTAHGRESEVEWPHFQLDGFGLLLWALGGHEERHGRTHPRARETAEVLGRYLARTWERACTDWWEEQEGMHAATLACITAGLRYLGDPEADCVVDTLTTTADWRLDASLVALATPLRVLPADRVPLAAIERELVSPGGGVHRHPSDTYYGGGEWLLLTALLGWHYLELGREEEARAKLAWVAAHATAAGELPEQSQDHLLDPDGYARWYDRWGPPPSPLLWSHAMALSLATELEPR